MIILRPATWYVILAIIYRCITRQLLPALSLLPCIVGDDRLILAPSAGYIYPGGCRVWCDYRCHCFIYCELHLGGDKHPELFCRSTSIYLHHPLPKLACSFLGCFSLSVYYHITTMQWTTKSFPLCAFVFDLSICSTLAFFSCLLPVSSSGV